MKNLPIEVLLKQQKEDIKAFDKLYFNNNADNKNNNETEAQKSSIKKSRKGRPAEISAKEKPKQKKEIFETTKFKSVDPRFESSAGDFDMTRFLNCYGFLKDLKKDEVAKNESLLKNKKKIKKMDKSEVREIKSMQAKNKQELNFIAKIDQQNQIKAELREDLKTKGVQDSFVRKREFIRISE